MSKAIQTHAGYIGLIGSRAKIGRIYRQLIDDGTQETKLKQVHSPIGLDIGARTPEEIAVSIVGQLISVRRRAYLKNPNHGSGFPEVKIPPSRSLLSES